MFVYSLKAATLKFLGAVLASVVIIGAVIFVMPHKDASVTTFTSKSKVTYDGMENAEDVTEFIGSFGIEVTAEPVEVMEVEIPSKFDAVLEEYEKLQKEQGLKLSKYKGKSATRYTYEVLNYPKDTEGNPSGKVFLNIIVCGKKVIAGDICSAEMGGFVKPFTDFKPENAKL